MKKTNPQLSVKQKYTYLLIGFGFVIILAYYAGYKTGQQLGERQPLETTD